VSQEKAPPGPPKDPATALDDEDDKPTSIGKIPGFSRPNTPTTPFSPTNAIHAALAEKAAAATHQAALRAQASGSHAPPLPLSGRQQAAPPVSGHMVSGPMSAPAPTFHAPPTPFSPPQHPSSGHFAAGSPSGYGHGSMMQPLGQPPPQHPHPGQPVVRTDSVLGAGNRAAATHVVRSRAYAFVLDARGQPIELGSGRFGKAFLGEERWLESKTDFRREVVIKILQKGVSNDDLMRFQMEKELLERVQGHPNIVRLFASGEGEDPEFLPASIRDKVECEFVILEKLEMSMEERLKGSRGNKDTRDDLLDCTMQERIFRVLDYMIPITSAIEFAHLVRNISHRDLKPANILLGLPNPQLRGSTLEVRLADFNVAKVNDDEMSIHVTRMNSVPGTLFFQSPEQETNVLELLVNMQQGSPEVEFFEDFYIQIAKNDTFALFNRGEQYPILYADRAKKKLVLGRPYRDVSESNVRAKIQKSVGRPADIYSLGAMLYYLISGAYANPKTLYDNFHKFIEYERAEENNTIESYLEHEYSVINSMRAPKSTDGVEVAPADRFFSYKHYLDGNGELIDPQVMKIIAKCMIRNKPDSYCQAHDVETRGVSDLMQDLVDLYAVFGVHPNARPQQLARMGKASGTGLKRKLDRFGNRLRWAWMAFLSTFRSKRK
jgi:serine/threonine protein kinase